MEANQAAENLQVIRTLMERSAVYRRALAPIMTLCGVLGIGAGILGWQLKLESNRAFVLYWSAVAGLALLGSFFLVRRQALKDAEPFWSPPTRRVAQALLLPFFLPFLLSVFAVIPNVPPDKSSQYLFIVFWLMFYGCAMYSAGFFISRGVRILGWIFGLAGCVLAVVTGFIPKISPALIMALLFGGLHLAAGVYLYFTEKRKNAA
jgi:hypothetical protein